MMYLRYHVCVRRNMDAVAICMLHDFFGKIDNSTNPFLFRRKLSILHRNIDTARILHVAICILR